MTGERKGERENVVEEAKESTGVFMIGGCCEEEEQEDLGVTWERENGRLGRGGIQGEVPGCLRYGRGKVLRGGRG